MDIDSLLHSLDTCGQVGLVLSTEESLILHNSLLLLQNENHFRKIFFWGRIYGIEKDYYIAFGYTKDVLKDRVYYYSTDCRLWLLLPKPTEAALMLTPLCNTKFHGDPALILDVVVEKDDIYNNHRVKETMMKRLKEEDRLTCTVQFISEDAFVVPRGALYLRPDDIVVENMSFSGLNPLEAQEVKTFVHFRKPQYKWNTNLLTRNDYNYAIDFLDTIDKDVPDGCFSLQIVAGGIYVVLRSLFWPGYMHYHRIGTPHYGSVYFGHGKKYLDLPFILPLL